MLTETQSATTIAAPTFRDVLLAQRRIKAYLPRTPLYTYPALDELLEARVYVKHDNHLPTSAFKVRGGVNLISQLSPEERGRGVIAASTGNHGQSVAFAARLVGARARVVVPERPNPGKVAAMRGMGAEVLFHGPTYDEARAHAEALAAEHGYRYISSGDEPLLIAGVATQALEMLEDEPELDALFVAVGAGTGAAGACIVADAIAPGCRVVGVQAAASPAAYESWRRGELATAPNRTFAEGLATGAGFDLPQRILRERLREFVLVSDEEILRGMLWLAERAHTLAEGAGAAPLAGAYKLREDVRGRRVGVVCCGANTTLENLRRALGVALP